MRIGHEILCASLWFALAVPLAARAQSDACTLLTPAEVTTAVGVTVGAGQHVTPAFIQTCTWMPSGASPLRAVTLHLQTASTYDGGKHMATTMAALGASMAPAAVGDDAYYFVQGDQVVLLVRHGNASFKVAVYAELPVAKKEAMELELARRVLGKRG